LINRRTNIIGAWAEADTKTRDMQPVATAHSRLRPTADGHRRTSRTPRHG
jgi:hypothetical protein